ncbi:SDR family NAD(P)-dependent oxidoreductase [Nocardia sp. NPDC052316]|uniref:SDR family NAD(P)-dependent oxidoreductase n=1 Tax=Nocardia sp. NPDC052316 TaxID=3364329 RepID=UPI0037C6D1BA
MVSTVPADLSASVLLSREDFVMANHHVHGTSVLPGAIFLDLLWRLARARGIEGCIRVDDIVFEEPVVTDQHGDRRLRLGLTRREGEFDVLITSVPVRGNGIAGTVRRHMTATMRILAEAPPSAAPPARDGTRFKNMADLYAQARSEHIVHGTPMRVSGELRDTGAGLIADIALDPAHPAPSGFHLHPALLDASTLIAFAHTPKLEYPYIPITIAAATLVAPISEPGCRVWVPAEEVHADTSDVMHNSYEILDATGGLVARIERLACKRIRHPLLISGLTDDDIDGSQGVVASPSASGPPSRPAGAASIRDCVRAEVAARLGVPAQSIDTGAGFYALGLDSVALLGLSAIIGEKLGVRLYPTVLFEFGTVDDLAEHLMSEHRLDHRDFEAVADVQREQPSSLAQPEAQAWQPCWVDLDDKGTRPSGGHSAIGLVISDPGARAPLRGALELAGWSVIEYSAVPQAPDPAIAWCVVAAADQVAAVEAYQDLVRELGRRAAEPSAAVVLGIGDDPAPELLGTGAFCRTATAEIRTLSAAVIAADTVTELSAVVAGLTTVLRTKKSGLFRLRRGVLQTLDYRPADFAAESALLRAGGRYLITGGAGGLGTCLAEYLITTHAAAVHLTGRRPVGQAVDARHATWRSSGATVTYTQCDVADAQDCVALVAALTREHGAIDGVFHLAGVLDDSVFITGSTQRTRAVAAPKLGGARQLWRAFDGADLDFFVSFTSISGVLANPGQSAYAYANSSLDFWSLAEHDTSCEVRTIAWPYWADGGMRSGSANGGRSADLPTGTGLQLLEKLLRRNGARHLCVTYGAPDEAQAAMVAYPTAHFEPVAAEPAEYATGKGTSDNSIGAAEPIAVIGLAGSYPGAADLRAFWQLLQAGEDAVSEIPDDTWPEPLPYSAAGTRGTSYGRWGGLLSERDHFAPAYFGISRRAAESMDPQERQFLMTAWRALEDAARPPESLRAETVGVFCGVMWNHYQLYQDADGVSPSALHSTIPNRVSYTFDFTGPSIALDTACSSSLVAVHLAVQSLRSGESTMALAGGVNITTHPHKYVQLSADSFLSRTGKCRTFGTGADGYVPGDGVGVVVLKPLRRAVADGDIVHAVIRGTSMNHNGRSAGFTVPDPAAQAALIAAALRAADVKPAEVGYLEAHGTGTALGDPIEATAIQREMSSGRADTERLSVGSVKTNIGHLESAAGIAGLTKAILQIEHGRIVPTLHSGELNAAVVEAAPSLEFPQRGIPWPSHYASRIAGVSAFGAGGTNVHVIVEAAPERSASRPGDRIDREVAVLLSADSVVSLRTFATDLRRWLHSAEAVSQDAVDPAVLDRAAAVLGVPGHEIDVDWALADLGFDRTMLEAVAGPGSFDQWAEHDLASLTLRALMTAPTGDPLLRDIAYTLRVGRRPRKVRLAVTCTTLDQLAAALGAYAEGQDEGPHHHSGAATNAVDGVARRGRARDLALAWCAGVPLDPDLAPAGRRLSLPIAPLETEICRLGGWHNRNSPPEPPRSAAVEGQVSEMPQSPESVSGHSFSLLPDGIALLRLDSPETHNMLTDELLALLATALERVQADDAVRVFVICGNGTEFCLGGTPEAVSDVATQRTTFADAAVIYEGLATCRKPVVTALAGNAFGGGLAFGLYGDLVVMSRDAYYSANFLRYGITPGLGATYILERRMGGPLSQEMLMSGREYSGRELERRGASVNFCDPDQVVAEAMSLARTVAGHPPAAVQQLKAHLSSASRQDLPTTIAAEMDMHRRLSMRAETEPVAAAQSYPRVADRVAVPDLTEAIVASVADILFAEPDEIDGRVSFRDQGLDSVGAVQLVRDLNERFDTDLESTVVYEHPTVEELAEYLASEVQATAFLADAARATQPAPEAGAPPVPAPDVAGTSAPAPEASVVGRMAAQTVEPEPAAAKHPADGAIAVVAMAGRWPDADDVEQFARNIAAGRSSITDVSRGRWDLSALYAPGRHEGKTSSRWAALLNDVESFDHAFFNLSPLDVAAMDCQQRLFLTESWKALAAAGHLSDARGRGCTGIYVGCAPGDHGERLRPVDKHETAQAFLGGSASILAARIAYFLNLRGPAIAVDTACSSSLVAVHLACQALLTAEVDTAVAGGVAVMETPSLQVRSSQVGMLSPTGTSAPFDAAADGIVLGEGVGVVVLRRLSDALRDGDQVLAVLRGTGVNGDGHTNGITAPNAAAQAELMTRTLRRAGVAPGEVSFVETHGTGTPLGDPIEISGLIESLAADQPAWLGSVKANIGHTTTAAGISSLIKTILCMQMEIVAPLVNHGVRNPAIGDLGRFRIPTRKQPWPFHSAVPRTAVVASYGFSGTNSVAIVQDVAPSLPWRADAAEEISADRTNVSSIRLAADDPVVSEHVVVGQRLLPAAATVEFTRTLLSAQSDAEFILHGVRWRAPVIVDDTAVVTVNAALPDGDTDSASRSISIQSAGEVPAVTASLELSGTSSDRPRTLDIAELSARCRRSVFTDRLYADFADAGLAYGPRYRRLTEVLVGEDLVVGTLDPAVAGFGAETAMIDAALQSLGALPGLGDGSALVPVAAQRISIWGPATRATTVVGERTGTTYRVVLADSNGVPLLEFDGLRLYPMSIEQARQPIPVVDRGTPGLVYTPAWVPLDESPMDRAQDGEVLVVAERSRYELGGALLQDAGGRATLVPFEQPSPGALSASVRSVIVLPGSARATTLSDTLSLLGTWYRVLRDEFGSDPLQLSLITRHGVRIAEREVPDALNSAVHGFAGAVAAEQPTWAVRCIDVLNDDVDLDEVREAMLIHTPNDSSHRVLALRAGRLFRRVFRASPGDGGQRLALGGRLVVIGATGAIGRTICAAAQGPCTQVWIGRRSAEQVAEHLESAGGSVHYLQADVGDTASIGPALREAERLLGAIDTVVHCAGELRDRRIADLTDEDFAAVLRPRVDGMRNLFAHNFDHSDPKFLVTSSAAAFVDSGGQANYAAACCALDAIAVAARSRGRDVTVVNWGYWDVGVASTSYHRALMAADGIVPLAANQAISALAEVLAAGHGQALVLAANAEGLSHFGIDEVPKPLRSSETVAMSVGSDAAGRVQQARHCIRRAFCEVLGFGEDELSLDATFETYGVSSVVGVQLLERLERDIGPLPPTLLYEEQTIRALADRIAGEYPGKLADNEHTQKTAGPVGKQQVSQAADAAVDSRKASSSGDVAVIGLAGRYPGAPDIATYWQNLLSGVCSLTEVPAERWNWRRHPDPRRGLQPYQAWGGFLTDPYCFDTGLFGVLPKVAEDIDPQERLFLETSWDLLERTGYLNDESQACATGVFVGVMYGGYGEVGARLAEHGTPNGAHTAYWSIANRVSYTLNLSGPSMAVDTACSSSLTAVHLAVQSLRDGECDIAVAGGVNLIAHPSHLMSLGERNMLAADGHVKVFDDAADGYVPGEGVGAVLLKPLDAALRDGDDVWAVIKGTAVNAGGHTSGFTVPNPQAQAEVITSAVRKAGTAPESISYVEAHGSGTALGDPIEISALGTAFRRLGSASAPPWVGSVKSNIGHLEGAAGIAGLTKTVLQLRHRTLAPMVGLDTVNPRIPFDEVGTQPVRSLTGWLPGPDGQPLRAGVSSFGAGGTNVHVVVEEAPARRAMTAVDGPFLVLLSCPDMARLREYATDIADFALGLSSSEIAGMAWTSQTGRRSFGYRLAVRCASGDELARQLRSFAVAADARTGDGIFVGTPGTRRAAAEDAVDDEALRRRDLERLAQLWVDGARIAWKQLWHKHPGKLAYPGVPLRRTFYSVPNPALESVAESSAPSSDPGAATQVHYEVPTWRPSPLGGSRRAVQSLGVLVLTEGDRPLAVELIDAARQRGIRAHALDGAAGTESVDALVLLFDPELLDPVMLADNIIRVVVEQTPAGRSVPPKLVCAWQTATHPAGPATAGLLRALGAERRLSASSIDLGAMDASAAVDVLLDEVGRDESAEVRYRDGHASAREIAAMVEVDMLAGTAWTAGPGSYVISGGGGKLGLATAAWLADAGAGTVWLLGRSAAGPEVRALTSRYGAGRIRFRQVDVTDADAVGRVLDEARAAGPLRGVVHAAGLLRDAPAAEKTASDIALVLSPKVTGVRILDAATAQDPLEFFVAYSSLVSRNGSPGQSDYAFANAYLDAACLQRAQLRRAGQRSGKTVSIGWPLWAAGGMRMPAAVVERLRRLHGMVPMSTVAGFEALARALRSEYPVVQVTELQTQRSLPPMVADPPAAPAPAEQVLTEVRRHAAEFLLVPASEVDLDAELLELGFDSISLTELVERLNAVFGTSVRPTAVFDNPTLLRLAAHFAESADAPPPNPQSDSGFRGAAAGRPSPISADRDSIQDVAIIGMAATIAAAASSAQLWESLLAGHDLVRPVPAGRHELCDDPAMAGVRGGFLSSAADFDADFFGIAPREAAVMDPQQRLFATVCWEAIWDAALAPEDLRGTATGVFAGVSTMDYQDLMSARGVPDRAHSATGLSHAVLANRVSHLLDLHGPSEAIDTACSSSLVAVHRAIRALRSGECTQALVGGVNLTLTAGLYRAFTDAGMLSAQGRCATFDAGADGYVRGEGAGALLLKPLSDALRDGDRVHAIIRGSAVNHTGRTASLTAPAPQAQGAVIRAAYRDAATELAALDYIETHGTGTRLGDPVEIDGIKQALGSEAGGRVLLGSIKASVGHLEAAAGMAGLVKTVQILRHRKVPGQLHLRTLNPQIDIADTALHIPTDSVDLPTDREIIAGVSSFGFGGTNAHVVLASAPPTAPVVATGNRQQELAIPVAAHDEQRLAAYARALAAGGTDGESIERVAATLRRRHRGGRVRAVLMCRDIGDFRAAAGALGAGQPHGRCLHGSTQGVAAPEPVGRWLAGQSVDWPVAAALTTLPAPPFLPVRHWFEEAEAPAPPTSALGETDRPIVDSDVAGVPTSPLEPGTVRDEVAAILGLAVGALDTSRTWRDLGLDSIFAVDLAERLTGKLGIDVTATAVVESATVEGLEAHLTAQSDGARPTSQHSLAGELALFLGHLTSSPVTAPADFDSVGLSSIDRLRAVGCLESHFGPLPKTLFYDYPSTTSLAEFFRQTFTADVVSGFTAASVTYSTEPAPVPAAGEVTEMFGGRMIRRADLPLHGKLAAAVTELSKTYRLEDALAGRDIAPFIYLPDHEKWYLDVGWIGDVVLVWGYTGPADSAIDAVADFDAVVSTAGARLSVLWPDPLDTVHDRQFHATPFGVMQEIGDIASFTVTGGEKRRLRGIIGKFQRAGQVRVEEYQVGAAPGHDRDIVRLIDAWSDGKKNVNPYVATIRAEVSRGELPPGHRVFLTFADDVIVAAVVISRLGVQNGYLLDVEFYDGHTPTGCLEYTVTEIIDRLRAERVEIFSLGAIFAVPVGESANADPALVDELAGMRDAGLTPLGNYHFKRKFKPAESAIYLCQPRGERSSIAEILLLIGDPELETRDTPATRPSAAPAPGGQVVADRVGRPSGNVLRLEQADIELDLISDSWADRDDPIVRARLSELLAAERAEPSWLPFEEVVLAPSGREAESLLCRAWPGPRGTVLHNGVFPTWLGSLAENRFTPRALDRVGADGLAVAVEKGLAALPGRPSFVLIELCPNSAGGVRIPDHQLARIRAACDRAETPLVLDATRVVDNVVVPGMKPATLAETLEATLGHADTITMSLSKNFALTAGGLVATSDAALSTGLRRQTDGGKGEFSALGRAVMKAGLADLTTAHRLVVERQALVAEFARMIRSYGVPTVPAEPTFAVCVPSAGSDEDAALGLASSLYQQTGVRVGPHLASPVHPGLDGQVRVAVPIGYADRVRVKMAAVATAIAGIHEQRTVLRAVTEDDAAAPWFANQLGQLRETYLTHLSDRSDHETTVPGNLRVLQRFCPSVRAALVEDDEGQVEVFEAGTGELPLVLMHPFNIGAGMFAYQFGRLARNRRIVVIHQPGVGRTRTTSSLSLDGLVDLQIRVLHRIGIHGRFHVGGASVGSIFAQWMALAHPDRVASLALLGGSYKFANRKGRIDKLDQVIADDFDSIEAGGVALGGEVRRAVSDLLMESESMDPRTGLRYLDLFAKGSDLTDKLSSVSVPALIVQGRHDSVVGVATGQFIHRCIADSEYVELANSGHFVCFTEPDKVCDLVAEFVARHDGAHGPMPCATVDPPMGRAEQSSRS